MTTKAPLPEEEGDGITGGKVIQARIAYRGERADGDKSFAKSANGTLPVPDAVATHWDIYHKGRGRSSLPYESEVRAFIAGWELCENYRQTIQGIGREQNMDLAMQVRGIARKEYDTELAAMLDACGVPVVDSEPPGQRLARYLVTLKEIANLTSLELLVYAAGEVERETKRLVQDKDGLTKEVVYWRGMKDELVAARAKAAILDQMEELLRKDRQ